MYMDVPYKKHNNMDCERSFRVCGARSGSPQLNCVTLLNIILKFMRNIVAFFRAATLSVSIAIYTIQIVKENKIVLYT